MDKINTNYSSRTIWIHWVSAILIFALIFTGIKMEHLEVNATKFSLYKIHFAIGTTVFVLTIIRVVALLKDPKPINLYPEKSTREKFRNFVYKSFYIVIIWMCLSGILSLSIEGILPALKSSNLADLPEITKDGLHPIMFSHHIIAKFVLLLLLLHIGGFLLHLFQKKENTLKRIWFK